MRTGKGTLVFHKASHWLKYVGDFLNGQKHGNGTLFWRDGIYYEGQFLNNQRHGFGTQYGANGKVVFEGKWMNDRKI